MTTLPTSPFPELHALDEKRKVPSLAELLSGSSMLPIEVPAPTLRLTPRSPLQGISRLPHPEAAPSTSGTQALSRTLLDMPVEPPIPEPTLTGMVGKVASSMEAKEPEPEEFAMPIPPPADPRARQLESPRRDSPPAAESLQTSTDDDLKEALLPMLEISLAKALYAPKTGLNSYLEPMLRSTVRRALAEQMDTARHFSEVGSLDRLAWRLSALFKSRSYDEIVFERTRRFQVEEVYLIRKSDQSLISYASHDPARHASTRRVQSTLRMLVRKLPRDQTQPVTSIDLPEKRLLLVREGQFCLLLAILRGNTNALVRADLDYVLRQAEDRFGNRLEKRSEAFLQVLQPVLEGCLLIQSPAPPR